MDEQKKLSLFDRIFRRGKQEQNKEQEKSYKVDSYEGYKTRHMELSGSERAFHKDANYYLDNANYAGGEAIRLQQEGSKKEVDEALHVGAQMEQKFSEARTKSIKANEELEKIQEANPEFEERYKEEIWGVPKETNPLDKYTSKDALETAKAAENKDKADDLER